MEHWLARPLNVNGQLVGTVKQTFSLFHSKFKYIKENGTTFEIKVKGYKYSMNEIEGNMVIEAEKQKDNIMLKINNDKLPVWEAVCVLKGVQLYERYIKQAVDSASEALTSSVN